MEETMNQPRVNMQRLVKRNREEGTVKSIIHEKKTAVKMPFGGIDNPLISRNSLRSRPHRNFDPIKDC